MQLPTQAYLARLRTSKAFRLQEQRGVVFGLPALAALLASPHADSLQLALHAGGALAGTPLPRAARLLPAPPALLSPAAAGLRSQPPASACAAVFALPRARSAAALLAAHPRALVLDRVGDPGNLGTLLRSCAALGWGALLTRGCCDPYNDKVLRAACGAVFEGGWAWLGGSGSGSGGEEEEEEEGEDGEGGPRALAEAEAEAAARAPAAGGAAPLTLLLVPGARTELTALAPAAHASARVRVVVGSEARGLAGAWLRSPALQQARLGPPGGVLNAAVAACVAMYACTPPHALASARSAGSSH
jgi:tRNA G18 (ribose-2'-O)-methylase SpoU